MRQLGTACVIAFGVAALLGGACALLYGLAHPAPTQVVGLGPLDGIWSAENYCFLGGVLVAVGGGLTTFGALVRSKPERVRAAHPWEPEGTADPARDARPAQHEAIRRGPDR
jgi:hypothetical protein